MSDHERGTPAFEHGAPTAQERLHVFLITSKLRDRDRAKVRGSVKSRESAYLYVQAATAVYKLAKSLSAMSAGDSPQGKSAHQWLTAITGVEVELVTDPRVASSEVDHSLVETTLTVPKE
jgi:hypothetical protein